MVDKRGFARPGMRSGPGNPYLSGANRLLYLIELQAQSVQSEIRTHKAEAGTFTASGCHPSPLLHGEP